MLSGAAFQRTSLGRTCENIEAQAYNDFEHLAVFVVRARAMFVVMVMPLVMAVVTLMVMVMWLIMVLASWFEVSGLVLEAPGRDLEIPGLDPGAPCTGVG